MKNFALIGIFIFIFFGCGGSGEGAPQYKARDSVMIVKNLQKRLIPYYKNLLKEEFEERFKGLPVVLKFKDYESESCISFGFRFKDVETNNGFIQTTFTNDTYTKSICIIQDYSIGDAKGKSGLVVFVRLG